MEDLKEYLQKEYPGHFVGGSVKITTLLDHTISYPRFHNGKIIKHDMRISAETELQIIEWNESQLFVSKIGQGPLFHIGYNNIKEYKT